MHHPDLRREALVRRRTSGLVDVERTEPVAASTFGTTNDDVLPDRDGPRTSAACSRPVHDHPPPEIPR
jgi:hypothetical protein